MHFRNIASDAPDVEAMKKCIAQLLEKIDEFDVELNQNSTNHFEIDGVRVDTSQQTMHSYGQTPDWYVEAAFLATYGQTSSEVNSTANKEARRIKDSWEV